jgi:hypothetical protein
MARSKPRKSKVVKVRLERTAQHLEHRDRKEKTVLIHDVMSSILRDCPPVKKEEPISIEEIGHWFDTDPEAPVILISMPAEGPSFDEKPQIRISINDHGVARELRTRGINQTHPAWELALRVVGPTLMDLTSEALQEAAQLMAARTKEGGWTPVD